MAVFCVFVWSLSLAKGPPAADALQAAGLAVQGGGVQPGSGGSVWTAAVCSAYARLGGGICPDPKLAAGGSFGTGQSLLFCIRCSVAECFTDVCAAY